MERFKLCVEKIKVFFSEGNKIWQSFIEKKFIKSIFLFLPHSFFLFFFFLLSLLLIVQFDYNQYVPIYTYQGVANSSFEPILHEPFSFSLQTIKKEYFQDIEKNPNQICLRFGTYDRKNNADYQYSVFKNAEKIYEEAFNARILKDGKFTCFSLPDVTLENVSDYSIEIAPIRVDVENAVTIFKNGESGEVAFQLVYELANLTWKNIFVFLFVLLSFGINFLINKKNMAIEKFWLLLSLVYILPATLITPPYEVPDEPIHFYTAYRLTQFSQDKNFYESLEDPYMTMPSTIGCLGYANIQTRDKVINKKEVMECFKNSENTVKKSIYSYVGPKIAFSISSLGIKVADIFSNSPGIIFYMGRLLNVFFSIFLIYKALKIAPKHKELLLVVASIPIFIQQMGSYSYDSLLNSFSLFAVAIIMKIIYDKEKIPNWCHIVLLLSGMIISLIKIVYLPIFLLLLFIPKEKFGRKINKYIYTFVVIISSYLLGNICKGITESGNIEVILSSLFTLLSVGICTNFVLKEKANWKFAMPVLFVLSVSIAFIKPLYLGIPFLMLLFLPDGRFKKKWHKYVGVFAFVFFAYLLGKIGASFFQQDSASTISSGSKVFVKLTDLVTHPYKALMLFYSTFKMKTIFYMRSLIGYFGWFNFRLNDIYVISYIFFFVYLLLKTEFIKVKWYEKGLVFLGLCTGILGVFLAMYVYWSGSELFYIDGVQGRYFLPVLLPVLLLFPTAKKKNGIEKVKENVFIYTNTILLEYIALLLLFYY